MEKSELSSQLNSPIAKSPTVTKKSTVWQKIAIAILSPVLFFGLLEGIAYVWERTQANSLYAWELVASRRLIWEPYDAPGAGFTLIKPGSHYKWQGISVDINSHGLRSPETTFVKPPATFRILSLGDSVAMGWGIREEDTYSRRLEALLNQQGAGDLHYEVITAGVPGWNLENSLAYLQAQGLKYRPDLILLDLTVANDIKGRSAVLDVGQQSPVNWLRTNTYFWPFLTIEMRQLEARVKGQERISVLDPPTDPAKYFPLDPQSEQWTRAWNQVLTINQIAQENKAAFVLILFPLEFQVLDESYPTLAQEILTARAAEAGIPVLDLLPAFRQACREKPGGACQREDRYLFADVWMHPSAYGHEVTTVDLDALITNGLMKDSITATKENQ